MRTISTLLAIGATTVALTAAAPSALAAPDTGSAGGSSSGCGPRSSADRLFLSKSHHEDESCEVQDAAIQLALSECRWLDSHGNSAHNQILVAERTSDTLEYPYTFLDAAITAYCPQHQL
ncbi:Protein of unknown function [Nocardia amikacinitolerans]|uniref:DUF732 domain-containing protein n=1 Tax=Nocardia amikacinitolerans TaxID=756689 RepID=A0A285LMB2_9NOCA|nr:DUF732 domain-containing protein [Nocardia amikacinitolerans]SNY86059.1 Protein of unknown function [Nocardia amikacinitolerans]